MSIIDNNKYIWICGSDAIFNEGVRGGFIDYMDLIRGDIRLVGNTNRSADHPESQNFPADGYDGETYATALASLSARAATLRYRPNIVVGYFGPQDVNGGASAADVFANAMAWARAARVACPGCKVLLSTLYHFKSPAVDYAAKNLVIDAFNVLALSAAGQVDSNIGWVDTGSQLTYSHVDNGDGVNLNVSGELVLGSLLAKAAESLAGPRQSAPQSNRILLKPELRIPNTSWQAPTAAEGGETAANSDFAYGPTDRWLARVYFRQEAGATAGCIMGYAGPVYNDYTDGWLLAPRTNPANLSFYQVDVSPLFTVNGALTESEDAAFYLHQEPFDSGPIITLWKASPNGIRLLQLVENTSSGWPSAGGKFKIGLYGLRPGCPGIYNWAGFCKGSDVPHLDDLRPYIETDWQTGRGFPGQLHEYALNDGASPALDGFGTADMIVSETWASPGSPARLWDNFTPTV